MTIKKLGLFGLGNQGLEHLIASQTSKHVHICAAFDKSSKQRSIMKKQYPQLNIVESAEALLNMPLDGYILALPHHVYQLEQSNSGISLWEALMKRGLPILKEKPLARNIHEARSFTKQAREANIYLQTAIQRRNHPSYKELKSLIRSHDICEINLTMNLGFNNPPKDNTTDNWRESRVNAGGGALLDCGYHMVDLALYLIGSFDLVAATTLFNGHPCSPQQIDDEVHLSGRSQNTWVHINSRKFNTPDKASLQGYPKYESVIVVTENDTFYANREGIWRGDSNKGKLLYSCDKNWLKAMVTQLDDFVLQESPIKDMNLLWEQLPAQQLIQLAYQRSETWCGGNHFEK